MKRITRNLVAIFFAFALLISSALPVFAIVNPDSMGMGGETGYEVFENVVVDGDMLFVAEGQVTYAVEPTDFTAAQAFVFEILNVAGNATLAATTLQSYGDRPISIYLSPAQIASLGMSSGTEYILRIVGNPAIFPSQVGNSINVTLTSEDYTDQSIGANSTIVTDNRLRNFCIRMAENMEVVDAPLVDPYITVVDGVRYLTTTGGSLFLEGIPGLNSMAPILFAVSISPLVVDTPAADDAYTGNLTVARKWGETTANGVHSLGLYLSITDELAGALILFALALMLGVMVYKRTQSGIATITALTMAMVAGAFTGLMPLALAFVVIILVVLIAGFYFFGRGAL